MALIVFVHRPSFLIRMYWSFVSVYSKFFSKPRERWFKKWFLKNSVDLVYSGEIIIYNSVLHHDSLEFEPLDSDFLRKFCGLELRFFWLVKLSNRITNNHSAHYLFWIKVIHVKFENEVLFISDWRYKESQVFNKKLAMAPRPNPVNPAHFMMCLRSLDPKTLKIMLVASLFVALCFGHTSGAPSLGSNSNEISVRKLNL